MNKNAVNKICLWIIITSRFLPLSLSLVLVIVVVVCLMNNKKRLGKEQKKKRVLIVE